MHLRYLIFILFLIPLTNLKAVDRIVQESGPSGTYASITLAVNAASDGDRIIIVNRSGGLPWQENVTVTKSLTFLPAVDGTRFLVLGHFSINPSTAGKHIRIIGMENLSGNIRSTVAAPAGVRTKIEIAGCDILGDINFDRDFLDVLVASNTLSGNVTIRFGNVYGNDMEDGYITVNQDGIPSNDVVDIIGNKAYQIAWDNTSQFFRIANNYVRHDPAGSGSALFIEEVKNSAVKINVIENNSVQISPTSCCVYTMYGLRFNSINAPNAQINVVNNAFGESTGNTSYGIRAISTTANIFASYNHISSAYSTELSGITNNGTNVTNLNVVIAANGLPTGSGITDGGHPGKAYTDHDLSRNDPGCFGGSFNIDNYYPLAIGPKTFHVEAPRSLFQGATLNVTSDGYDR